MTVKTDEARTIELNKLEPNLIEPPKAIQSKEAGTLDDDDRPRTTSETLGIPELTHNQHGHATLLDDPAPLSSLLHLPALIKEDASST